MFIENYDSIRVEIEFLDIFLIEEILQVEGLRRLNTNLFRF